MQQSQTYLFKINKCLEYKGLCNMAIKILVLTIKLTEYSFESNYMTHRKN